MTTLNKLVLGLLGMAMPIACDEDDSQPAGPNPSTPVSVQFSTDLNTRKTQQLKIIDDELRGKARSFESFGGGWSAKNTYEYDQGGVFPKFTGRITRPDTVVAPTRTSMLQTD